MNEQRSTLYALLIGIDHYPHNHTPQGSYASLGGCVRDVERVEAFLRLNVGVPPDRIRRLLSKSSPQVPADVLPTYENLVLAFKELTAQVKSGEQVYIHYAGHGGRAVTRYPRLKTSGFDEALVPIDIGSPDGQYLRDLELAYLLQRLVDRGAHVTLVLDACHSGGATRGGVDAVPRSGGFTDQRVRFRPSLVAPEDELVATWPVRPRTRAAVLGSGWLPEPRDYVLLAACRESELAVEADFGGVRGGVLTHYWLKALTQLRSDLTYRQVHAQILGWIHGEFPAQTPVLEGAGDRTVFGAALQAASPGADVLSVDEAGERVWLSAGQAHGMRKGVLLAVYPAGLTARVPIVRQALVELTEVGATQSCARFVERSGHGLAPGAKAVLVDVSMTGLLRRVRLCDEAPAWAALRAGLGTDQERRLAEATPAERAHYQVRLVEGIYQICDPSGAPYPNLAPAIRGEDKEAAQFLLRRLNHLARYHTVLGSTNHDSGSPLAGGLVLGLHRAPPDFVSSDPPPDPFEEGEPGPVYQSPHGAWHFLTIENRSRAVLNIALLNLKPLWGISQIYPSTAAFRSLDPGQTEKLPLRFVLPKGIEEGIDILKVMAAVGAADFRWLELPDLDQPLPSDTRVRDVLMPASWEWTTAQIEVHTRREEPQ